MLPAQIQLAYGVEFRRCLVTMDVAGMITLWKRVAPNLPQYPPAETMMSMHMARLVSRTMPRKLKAYSTDWLKERGVEYIAGAWKIGKPKNESGIAEAVGIASKSISGDLALSNRVVQAMSDSYLNSIAKGITEPPMQKELMLKARDRVRFKSRKV
jgi:hypothetical protein